MKQKLLLITISALTLICLAIIAGHFYTLPKKMTDTIVVTGLGQKDFISDIIVWRADLSVHNKDLDDAYTELQQNRELINSYLLLKGLTETELSFSSIGTSLDYNWITDQKGNEKQVFAGYDLEQEIEVLSTNVDLVEELSREITDLLEQGIRLYSREPEYYYTKLGELKHQMIQEASKEARHRAELITEEADSELGRLKNAKMGVFQITGRYTDEDLSWGGIYNTESKYKTASVTVRLEYILK